MADISSLKINGKVYAIMDTEIRTKLSKFLDYTGTDFDQLSEIVTYIKNNKASFETSQEDIASIKNILNKAIDSDDETLDQLSEIVAYIKANNKSISDLANGVKSVRNSIPTKVSQLTWDKTLTKEDVGLDKVDNTADKDKSVKYANNAGTVGGFTVGINVPANAKFDWRPVVDNLVSEKTDESLSANQGRVLKGLVDGKVDSTTYETAIQHLEEEIAKKSDASGSVSNALTVNGHTVNSDVPANAVFTDTTYGVVSAEADGLAPSFKESNLSKDFDYSSQYLLGNDLKWHLISEGKKYKPGPGISITDDGTISCSIGSLGVVSANENGLVPALSEENLSTSNLTSDLRVFSSDLKWHKLPSTAFTSGSGSGTGSNILIEAQQETGKESYILSITF